MLASLSQEPPRDTLLPQVKAAIHVNGCAGDVASSLAAEESDGQANVSGCAEAERNIRRHLADFLLAERLVKQLRIDTTRSYGIDP